MLSLWPKPCSPCRLQDRRDPSLGRRRLLFFYVNSLLSLVAEQGGEPELYWRFVQLHNAAKDNKRWKAVVNRRARRREGGGLHTRATDHFAALLLRGAISKREHSNTRRWRQRRAFDPTTVFYCTAGQAGGTHGTDDGSVELGGGSKGSPGLYSGG